MQAPIVTGKSTNAGEAGDKDSILEADSRWKLAERVAHSSTLARANQLRDILLYIVRQSVLNPGEPIREFDIAYRILGRRSDFNPVDDNIVRVQMAHLRKKLDLFFSTEGKDERVVINVALGSYKPVFSSREKAASPGPLARDEDFTPASKEAGNGHGLGKAQTSNSFDRPATLLSRLRNGRTLAGPVFALVAILALAVCCAALWLRARNLQQSLEAMQQSFYPWKYEPAVASLWSDFVGSNRNTDVILSDDSFLLIQQISKQSTPFSGYLSREYVDESQGQAPDPFQRYIVGLLASKNLGSASEFVLARRILGLDPQSKSFHLYSARQYMPALVKQDNVILIGGRVSNPWVELYEDRLNFIMNTKFEGLGLTTVTNRAPAKGEQQSYVSSDTTGYCVVAYLPNPERTAKVLLIEGTSSEATEAAGDFLLSEGRFSAFREMLHANRLPYFELLLKTSQVRGTPLTAAIEAYRTYPHLD